MNDLTTIDQCVARQRELEKQLSETKDKPQRELLKTELLAVLERMRVLKAERKASKLKAPGPKQSSSAAKVVPAPSTSKAQPEVIVLRRSARPPSRPPEALPQPREPRPFADLRQGISEATRRHR